MALNHKPTLCLSSDQLEMYTPSLKFPTVLHEAAAETAWRFFGDQPAVDSVRVVNSCARGQAVAESDLDMIVLLRPGAPDEEASQLEKLWRDEMTSNQTLLQYRSSSPHAHVHLDLINGQYKPTVWDDGGGPDGFELEIGNHLAYSAPMHETGKYFLRLQSEWLPYYPEDLRRQRLNMAHEACQYDLDHVPFFVGRELYFQAFDRLYKSLREFLQTLFISRRVYPLAYDKWIRFQLETLLGLPDLYPELPPVLAIHNLESHELVEKAQRLAGLLSTVYPE